MNLPVDLTDLRNITGGDTDLEAELFAAFLTSSDECLQKLRLNVDDGHDQEWRAAAHAFKGISLGLGAAYLSDLCKKAQMECTAACDEKTNMLAEIEQALELVRCQLMSKDSAH